jgi:hypothetical protein
VGPVETVSAHRVPIDLIITPPVEAAACIWFKIPEWKWENAKQRFPKLLIKVNQKRLRRIEYALAVLANSCGKRPVWDGWDALRVTLAGT